MDSTIDLKRTHQVTDAVHDTIRLSGLERAIINTPIFNRLHRVLQSSMVFYTYSSNRVKRFEHSVGTMYIAGEILYKSILNTPDSNALAQLINEAEKELINWYENVDFVRDLFINSEIQDKYNTKPITIAPVPECALYKEYRPNDISDEHWFVYAVLFESIRLAGLLHDLGHLPYSHIFEYAVSTLYRKVQAKMSNELYEVEKEFLDLLCPYFNDGHDDNEDSKELHEELSKSLVDQIEAEISKEFPNRNSEDNLFVAAIMAFTKEILKANLSSNDLFSDLHRIIAGVVDADRLDYCSRDLVSTGLRKDVFPYQRLISTYELSLKRFDYDESDDERKHVLFCPAEKGIYDVEELLERRWTIFSRINYEHRVHKYEVLFTEVLARIGEEELQELGENKKNLPQLTNGIPLPLSLCSIWSLVKALKQNNDLLDYHIIQLDDSWMDTFLKTTFFKKYKESYRAMSKHETDPEWFMFDELTSTRKHFRSLYKRSPDFNKFDKLFRDEWLKEYSHILQENGETVNSDILYKLTNSINDINDDAKNTSSMAKTGFAVNRSVDTILPNESLKRAFYQKIEDNINQYLHEKDSHTELNILHCFIRPCNISLGCVSAVAPVYFHGKDGKLSLLDHVSETDDHLRTLKDRFLPFHVYYLPVPSFVGDYVIWNEVDVLKLEECICKTLVSVLKKEIENLPLLGSSENSKPTEAVL